MSVATWPRGVLDGVEVSPPGLALGTVATGERVIRTVDILDRRPVPRKIARASGRPSNQATTRLLPVGVPSGAERRADGGVLIGRVEIDFHAREAGRVDDVFEVELEGEARAVPLVLTVTGTVAPVVQVVPSAVVLPRNSDAGPVYTATCLCRTFGSKPFSLRILSCPEGYQVRLPEGGDLADPRRVEVERLGPPATASSAPVVVKLIATVESVDYTLDVAILSPGRDAP